MATLSEITGLQVLTATKDILIVIATIITASVAIHGLKKWKTELTGKAEFEAAKALMKSVYKLRNEIIDSRSPFISGPEFPEDYSFKLKKIAEEEGGAYAHVYHNRWKPISAALSDLEASVLEAEALWGKEVKEAEKKINSVVKRLRSAFNSIVRDAYSLGENFKDKAYRERVYKDAVTGEEEDDLALKLNQAVEAFESIARPHLRR